MISICVGARFGQGKSTSRLSYLYQGVRKLLLLVYVIQVPTHVIGYSVMADFRAQDGSPLDV